MYLWREDMSGLYLSLNQGMTEIKEQYKADAKTALIARAAHFRALLGKETSNLPLTEIDLKPSNPSNPTSFYEAGNICAVFYEKNAMPTEEQLLQDLQEMLRLYDVLIKKDPVPDFGDVTEEFFIKNNPDDQPQNETTFYEDTTVVRFHQRVERNAKLIKAVKAHHGHRCQVCEIDFEEVYGAIGQNYIEAHHLQPLASLKSQKIQMDVERDFAVLCANCHRMIHRSEFIGDIEGFKKHHFQKQHDQVDEGCS